MMKYGWMGLLALVCGSALAQQRQLGPDPTLEWEGPMNFAATAASLLSCQMGSCADGGLGFLGQTCQGLTGAEAMLDTIPVLPGLRVVHARVSWIASTPGGAGPDMGVTLVPPGGQPIAAAYDPAISQAYEDGLPDQDCQLIQGSCPGAACDLGFYAANADITDALNAHLDGGGTLNGVWALSDAEIAGSDPNDPATSIAGAASVTLGAWSLLIVYEQADLPLRRLYYYQGFEELAGENRLVRPRGFRAPPDPVVDVTYLILEGDDGIQGDSLTINGIQIDNACNPRRNVYNSTVSGHRADGTCERGVQSVDLDAFRVENALEPADESADIEFILPRGDGLLTQGEQVFTAWLMLAFDHVPANFATVKPEKSAQPPSGAVVQAGEIIDYLIVVENTGGDFAGNVTVIDGVPAGTTYVAGSTSVDQRPIADLPGGQSPLNVGLNLQTLPDIELIEPGERHIVRFQVTVNSGLDDGTPIRNVAQITADAIDPGNSDPVVHFVGIRPDGGIPPDPDMGLGLDMGLPTPDRGLPDPVQDAEPPLTDSGCRVGERRTVAGECVPIECPEGQMLVGGMCVAPDASICGPGQVFNDGRCEAICAEGLRWDPTCAEGAGQCRYIGDPPCSGAASDGAASDDCGCDLTGQSSPPVALLGLLGLLALRRRRARATP
jgi:uncharacterized repeat protein (TIGR01451 family)/MYXO-CTERM domain-containing protein